MSFLSKQSQVCTKSELDLFMVPPTQTSVESARIVEYESYTENSDGPLHFTIIGVEDEYLDLSQTYLYVKSKITNSKGEPVADTNVVGPTNLFLHSMFSQVDISIKNQKITSSVNTYPYRCYIETLLNYGEDAKTSHLGAALFHKDTAGQMESIATSKAEFDEEINEGWLKRRNATSKGEFDMFGRIHADLFFQDRYLLDNVNVDVKLTKARDSFCLIGDGKDEYKVKFLKAVLHVRQVRISPDVRLAHAKVLENNTAKYPIKRVETKAIVISKDLLNKTLEGVSTGHLPNRIVFGLVDSDSYNGDYKKNCFNFKHYNLSRVAVTVNGHDAPYSPIEVDFKNNLYTKAYYSLFTGLDRAPLDLGNNITKSDYKEGYTLFAFDLTPDMCSGEHLNLIKSGNVRIDLKFSEALPNPVCCVVYMEYEGLLEINKARNIAVDFII